MRRVVFVLAILALPALAIAKPVHDETVTIQSGGEQFQAYLVRPDAAGPSPALILIHEWWGLNDQVKGEARKFAEQGFVALAPDLYHGSVTGDPSMAHELMRGLPQDRGVRDLKAAFAFLAARADVRKDKIGSVGWCMGGGYSLQLAVNEPKLAACVVNYGAMPTSREDIQKIQAPVLGNFGAEDRGIKPEAVQAFEKAMKAASKSVDIKIYPGAGHAFHNANNKLGYHQTAAEDSWKRTLAFLDKTLK
ncbi:MAG: dienelactone hydrolase family protein [Acidobacteria bacterium]|nr:dienelactone hydrolase family protein [Acidobacteriota bacterium]